MAVANMASMGFVWLSQNDAPQLAGALLFYWLTSTICLAMVWTWLYFAIAGLRGFGRQHRLPLTPVSIACLLVPFACILLPYKFLRDAWDKLQILTHQNNARKGLLKWWWGLHFASIAWPLLVMLLMPGAVSLIVYAPMFLLNILANALAIATMWEVHKTAKTTFQYLQQRKGRTPHHVTNNV